MKAAGAFELTLASARDRRTSDVAVPGVASGSWNYDSSFSPHYFAGRRGQRLVLRDACPRRRARALPQRGRLCFG